MTVITKTPTTTVVDLFAKELEQEALTTRKMLARVPEEHFDWQPHQKSMSLRRLATHVAELPGWIGMILITRELDFSNTPYAPVQIDSTAGLLQYFDKCLADGRTHLAVAHDEQLSALWSLRDGDQVHSTSPKGEVLRMTFSQIIHHRAQLGVYLRLLDIPLPGSYGPSADEVAF